jgi:hypothetical protein
MDSDKYAACVGKQIQNVQTIYCPRCLDEETLENRRFKQPLSAVGDFEDELFCPHCDLTLSICVTHTGN